MSLEKRVAHWVELGVKPYDEVMNLQQAIVRLRAAGSINDMILSVQHPLCVNFGASRENNQFSSALLSSVRELFGSDKYENVLNYLSEKRIPFFQSDRGGGATVFAPGQYVFYPVVMHSKITGRPSIDIGAYKSRIYQVLFDSLANLGVKGINVSDQQQFANRNERRDVWLARDGRTLKMGSKGIKISGSVAYHGFSLYVDAESIKANELVNQCGYTPDEVSLWTVEHELGRRIKSEEVYDAVQKAFYKNFGYEKFIFNNNLQMALEVGR